MFKLNLKIAWRNLRKYKAYTAVNILGLSLGLAGFIFMILFINREKSYDSWDPQLENIYQVQEYSNFRSTDKKAHWSGLVGSGLIPLFNETLPGVEAVCMINKEYKKQAVTLPGKAPFLQGGFRRSDSLFFKVLPYKFIYGNAQSAFDKPETIVLKQSIAKKFFGDVNPVGKVLTIAGGPWRGSEDEFTVTGVIEDPVTPSILNFEAVFFAGSRFFEYEGNEGDETEMYVKLRSNMNADKFNNVLQQAYLPLKDRYLQQDKSSLAEAVKAGNAPELKITPIAQVHQAPLEKKSWRETLQPVLMLSVLLLIVSIINFINLATAQAAGRAKEIGVKKVVGAYRKTLVLQFLIETFLQCLVAMFIALFLIEITLPVLNEFFQLELSLLHNTQIGLLTGQVLLLVIVVAVFTGVYPAFFLSSYKPQQVLKGNFSTGKSGSLVRKVLVGVQFTVSASFIVGILVINYQLSYLRERDNGFSTDGLMNLKTYVGEDAFSKDRFDRIKRIDGVKNVAFTAAVIGDNWTFQKTLKYKGEPYEMHAVAMGIEGLEALDARLLKGRLFDRKIVSDTINNVILNESAEKLFGRNMVGEAIDSNDTTKVNVVGVIKDIQVEGFENLAKPSVYLVNIVDWKRNGIGGTHKQSTLIKFDKSKFRLLEAELEKIFAEMNQFYPVSYSLIEDDFSAALIEHERFGKLVAVFSTLSLVLSLFGLFSLAAFITRQRTKEIAVRKVLGAETIDIMVLLNKGYLWILIISNAIAFPLAYILVNKWLNTFAYRVEISPLPFIIAFFISLTITMLTVTLQARKVVSANPVDALKYE